MWFGFNDGVRVYDGLTWTTYTLEHGIAGAPVLRLFATQDGSVYASTEVGISRFKDGTWTRVLPLEADQLWDVADLMEGSDGSLWTGTRWGALDESTAIGDIRLLLTDETPVALDQPVVVEGLGSAHQTAVGGDARTCAFTRARFPCLAT